MAYQQILYEVRDQTAFITLNRPDRLNAWTGRMHHEVKSAMRAAADDDDVRVIVLTGAGRGFCAGADMEALQGIQQGSARSEPADEPFDPAAPASFQKTYSYFPAVPKPIIAAINGACAGLGFVIALYADIRLASDAAVFTTAFSRRGLVAEHGVSWLLPRLIGFSNAADLLFSARRVSATEAAQMGLINRAIPFAEFE
ncbi:MAG: enoyl-CoA hydratase-related protein, partial [Caulobacteraceae bacterium]